VSESVVARKNAKWEMVCSRGAGRSPSRHCRPARARLRFMRACTRGGAATSRARWKAESDFLCSAAKFHKTHIRRALAHTSPLSPPRPTSRLHSAQCAAPRDAAQRMSSESAAGECPHFLSRTILFRGLNKRAPASPSADPLPALAQTPCLLTSRTFRTWTPRARMASASSTTRCETNSRFLLPNGTFVVSAKSRAPLRARGSPPCPPPHRR
jgi:hypothetical protein